MFEAKLVGMDKCCFVTLTIDESNNDGKVHVKDMQDYLKRLRYHVSSKLGCNRKIRFFCCGEYGRKSLRPHYHLILMGISPVEYTLLRNQVMLDGRNRVKHDVDADTYCWIFNNADYYFDDLWPRGWTDIQPCTPADISYVAGYCNKVFVNHDDNHKPFRLMSRKPGLGYDYIKAYPDKVMYRENLHDDFVTLSRYVEDKMCELGHLDKAVRKAQKDDWLLQLRQNLEKISFELGKPMSKVERESFWQINRDLEAILRLREEKL